MTPAIHKARLRTLRETPDIRIACSSSLGRVRTTAHLFAPNPPRIVRGAPLLQKDRRADRRTA